MRQAACVAGAWVASSALPVVAVGEVQRYPRSLLVDSRGSPWLARRLKEGEAFLFNYPYTVSPVFLIAFEHEVKPAELVTEDKLTMPCIVDGMDDKVGNAYAGRPDRICIVGVDGNVVYYTLLTPCVVNFFSCATQVLKERA